LADYNTNALKWKEHTATTDFANAFEDIMTRFATDNERRASCIEELFIDEALKAGVIKISKTRKFKNPNRYEKQMAPWFSDACREARNTYKQFKKVHGRKHHKTITAYSAFRRICKTAKAQF
jgi:hypothetical protein